MIFRFDDICVNANIDHCNNIARMFIDYFPESEIWYAISPTCVSKCGERVYPRIWNAYSDYTTFYNIDKSEMPVKIPDFVHKANHGLIHVDHRLLNYYAQEMSILAGASLSKSSIFVPPFNKWNGDTESICHRHDIKLVKFEDGWRCLEYEDFDLNHKLWYLHAREMAYDDVKNKIKKAL